MSRHPLTEEVTGPRSRSTAEIVELLVRRWRSLLLAVGVTASGALVFGLTRPPSFRAEARLYLEEKPATSGVLGQLAALTSAPPAAAEMEVLKSRTVAGQLLEESSRDGFAAVALEQRVDDLDRFSPWRILWRSLFGDGDPSGGLRVMFEKCPPEGLERPLRVFFPAQDEVEITWAGWRRGESLRTPFRPGESLGFHGIRIAFLPQGDLTGRSFLVSRTSSRKALQGFLDRLQVAETRRGSGVLRASYADRDPDRAALVLNALCTAYLDHYRSRLTRRAGSAATFIAGEIERVRGELDAAEDDLVAYQEESGAVAITESARTLIERMSELELDRARLDILIRSQEDFLDLIRSGAARVEDVAAAGELDPVLAEMTASLFALQAETAEMQEQYTSKWPPLQELRARLRDVRQRVEANLAARLNALRDKRTSLERILDDHQAQLEGLPSKERDMARHLKRAESLEQIYTFLLAQLQETKIAEAAAVAPVDVIDWAVPPLTRFRPNLKLHALIGILLGLALGAAFVLFRDSTLRVVLDPLQLRAVTGLPVLGAIPDFRHGRGKLKQPRRRDTLPMRDDPSCPASEAYRALRAYLIHGSTSSRARVIAVTAAGPGEGKSTTSANLAIALANSGSRVLLVDTDLRKPVLHRYFNLGSVAGLSEVLHEQTRWGNVLQATGIENLDLICSGKTVANPADLLAGKQLALMLADVRRHFDYVLLDLPPLLPVGDAAGFLSLLDGVILLCRADRVPEGALLTALRRIQLSGAKVLGAILNAYRPSMLAGAYGAYGYGTYANSYGQWSGSDPREPEEALAAESRVSAQGPLPPSGT